MKWLLPMVVVLVTFFTSQISAQSEYCGLEDSEIIDISRSVVMIRPYLNGTILSQHGSGVIVEPGGLIATNRHVLRVDNLERQMTVEYAIFTVDDPRDIPQFRFLATPVLIGRADGEHDLDYAELQITWDVWQQVPVAPSDLDLPHRPWTRAEEIPLNLCTVVFGYLEIADGRLDYWDGSAKPEPTQRVGGGEERLPPQYYTTNALIGKGSSGGPAVDGRGEIIGLATKVKVEVGENVTNAQVGGILVSGYILSLKIGGGIDYVTESTVLREAETSEGVVQVISRGEDSVRDILERANDAFNQGDFAVAVEEYNRVLQVDPSAHVYSDQGSAYFHLGQFDLARDAYQLAVQANPEIGDFHFNLGLAYIQLGDPQAAINSFNAAIELDPEEASYYDQLGVAYIKQSEYDSAIDNFRIAIELDPLLSRAYSNLGVAYGRINDYERAFDYHSQAIALDPEIARLYWNRAATYYHAGALESALADYNTAIALDPEVAEYYYDRASVYFSMEDWENAINDYEAVIALEPQHSDAYHGLGAVYGNLGQPGNAIPYFDQSIDINPEDSQAYEQRGRAHAAVGDVESAAADYFQWISRAFQPIRSGSAFASIEATVDLRVGEAHYIPFSGSTGQVADIVVEAGAGTGIDPIIVILDPNDTAIISNDDRPGDLNSAITDLVLPSDGTYTLVVAQLGNAEGNVNISIEVE